MSLSKNIEQEIVFYIQNCLDKGIPIYKIKNALLNAGHKQDVIKVAMSKTEIKNADLAGLVLSIRKEIEVLRKKGLSEKQIIMEMSSIGHTSELIYLALEDVRVGDRKDYKKFKLELSKYMLPFGIGFLVLLILLFATFTQAPLLKIFVGFSPSIISIMIIYITIKKLHDLFLWIIPVLVAVLFYVVATSSGSPVFETMNIMGLLIINIVISEIYTIAMFKSYDLS